MFHLHDRTLISYNVPPYGRAGLYLELANLKELLSEYKMEGGNKEDLREAIWSSCQKSELISDIPLHVIDDEGVQEEISATDNDTIPSNVSNEVFNEWINRVSDYLNELQDRLFSQGLHVLGSEPTNEQLTSYLMAYFGDKITSEECEKVILACRKEMGAEKNDMWLPHFEAWVQKFMAFFSTEVDVIEESVEADPHTVMLMEAEDIVKLLSRTTEELDSVVNGLDGGYVPPAPGGDLLREYPLRFSKIYQRSYNLSLRQVMELLFFLQVSISSIILKLQIIYLFVLQVEIFMLWIHIGCQVQVLGHVAREPLRKQYASIKKRMILHIQKLLVC